MRHPKCYGYTLGRWASKTQSKVELFSVPHSTHVFFFFALHCATVRIPLSSPILIIVISPIYFSQLFSVTFFRFFLNFREFFAFLIFFQSFLKLLRIYFPIFCNFFPVFQSVLPNKFAEIFWKITLKKHTFFKHHFLKNMNFQLLNFI